MLKGGSFSLRDLRKDNTSSVQWYIAGKIVKIGEKRTLADTNSHLPFRMVSRKEVDYQESITNSLHSKKYRAQN